jgi:hypothetical protein
MDLPSVPLPFSIEGGLLYAQTHPWQYSAAFTDVSTHSHELWRTYLPAKVLAEYLLSWRCLDRVKRRQRDSW